MREELAETLLVMPASFTSYIIPRANDVVENGRHEVGITIAQRSVEVDRDVFVGLKKLGSFIGGSICLYARPCSESEISINSALQQRRLSL